MTENLRIIGTLSSSNLIAHGVPHPINDILFWLTRSIRNAILATAELRPEYKMLWMSSTIMALTSRALSC